MLSQVLDNKANVTANLLLSCKCTLLMPIMPSCNTWQVQWPKPCVCQQIGPWNTCRPVCICAISASNPHAYRRSRPMYAIENAGTPDLSFPAEEGLRLSCQCDFKVLQYVLLTDAFRTCSIYCKLCRLQIRALAVLCQPSRQATSPTQNPINNTSRLHAKKPCHK